MAYWPHGGFVRSILLLSKETRSNFFWFCLWLIFINWVFVFYTKYVRILQQSLTTTLYRCKKRVRGLGFRATPRLCAAPWPWRRVMAQKKQFATRRQIAVHFYVTGTKRSFCLQICLIASNIEHMQTAISNQPYRSLYIYQSESKSTIHSGLLSLLRRISYLFVWHSHVRECKRWLHWFGWGGDQRRPIGVQLFSDILDLLEQ
jgi:hypothetical protein